MKNYWVAFILITTTGLACLGLIVFKCFVQKPQAKLFYLNVDSMKMIIVDLEDSTRIRPGVDAVFPCGKTNTGSEAIPWADLYVCTAHNKIDSLTGDTAMLLIDINTKSDVRTINNIIHYGASIKPRIQFKRCRVMVPANQIDNVRKRRYKFGRVTLVDDWLYD